MRYPRIGLNLLLFGVSSAYLAAQSYTFQTPDCGGLELTPSAVDNAGTIVGAAFALGAEVDSGFIYTQGQCTVTSFGGRGTDFLGITNKNKIFGLFASDYEYELTAKNGFGLLPKYPGSDLSYIVFEDSSGVMAGNYYPRFERQSFGFFYKDGVFTALPAGPNGESLSINGLTDDGVIIGTLNAAQSLGFVIRDGQNTFLAYPGASQTYFEGINSKSIIVGTYLLKANGNVNVFTYDLDHDIWTDLAFPAPYNVIHPVGISDSGVIVAQANPEGGLVIATPPGN